MSFTLDTDFNKIRTALIEAITYSTGLDQNHAIVYQPESQNWARPTLPYMTMHITVPGARYGDDTKQNLPGSTEWVSGGPRKMTVSFQCYGSSHEQAYNLMSLWQTSLDEENTQEMLREAGLSVLIIGSVADLSALLNTGYEGRAQMDCQFGLAMNLTSDLGEMDTAVVQGSVTTDQNQVATINVTGNED